MLVNLTPHPMSIYTTGTPERVSPENVTPIVVIPPSPNHEPARLGQRPTRADDIGIGLPVQRVIFGQWDGQPNGLPPARPGIWYIVSTLVALAHPHRDDLLVPYGTVRDLDGNVIGSTGFARPVTTDGGAP